MATKVLRVWIIDPADHNVSARLDTTPRYVNVAPLDEMKKQAKEHIARADFKIRSLNHTTDGDLVAYVYPQHLKAKSATKPSGWVFKRTSIPSHK